MIVVPVLSVDEYGDEFKKISDRINQTSVCILILDLGKWKQSFSRFIEQSQQIVHESFEGRRICSNNNSRQKNSTFAATIPMIQSQNLN